MNPWEDETTAEAVARQDAEWPVCEDCGERRGMGCVCRCDCCDLHPVYCLFPAVAS